MKGFIFLVVSVGSLALAPPSAGAVIIPPPDGSLTIAASPTRITVGDSTTISGKLSGSLYSESAVSLEANPAPFASGFQSVATTKTDANGNYSFANVRPALNTRYRTVTECVTICPLEGRIDR
jgi:hypothetical protein